jgi:hypothetical protein
MTHQISPLFLDDSFFSFQLLRFFNSQTFREELVIPVSFSDVKGTLTPTVTTAFIDAVCTLGQIKKPALTHKTSAINNICRGGFLPFVIMSQPNSFHFTNSPRILLKVQKASHS